MCIRDSPENDMERNLKNDASKYLAKEMKKINSNILNSKVFKTIFTVLLSLTHINFSRFKL